MSLGGLALGIGMLVDSSIVVLESIHRCREEGDDLAAAVRGTDEVRCALCRLDPHLHRGVLPDGVRGGCRRDRPSATWAGGRGFAARVAAVALYFIPMLASRGEMDLGEPWANRLSVSAAWQCFRASFGGASPIAAIWFGSSWS